MIVYIETNFVLQLALRQEHNRYAEAVLKLAEQEKIQLFIPWFCIGESYSKLTYLVRERMQLADECQRIADELSRDAQLRDSELLKWFLNARVELGRFNDEQVQLLDETTIRILKSSKTLRVDANRVQESRRVRKQLEFRASDSIVYGCVLEHAKSESGEKCFLNNDKAFHQPLVRKELKETKTKVLAIDKGSDFLTSGEQN